MKKYFNLIILLSTFILTSQNIKFDSASASLGYFRTIEGVDLNYGGISYSFELYARLNKNKISLRLLAGEDLKILGSSSMSIAELNILYGRNIAVSKVFYIEPFIGLGYYRLKDNVNFIKQDVEKGTTYHKLAFPIQVNIGVQLSKHLDIGIINSLNINPLINHYSQNLYLKYKL
jgi:hypothetical protein